MKISETGLTIIKQFEGFSAIPYICPGGKPTIGYGHAIKPGEEFTEITEQEATTLLTEDIAIAESAINQLVVTTINQNQFDALASFIYNIGVGAFKNSTLLNLVNAQNPIAAHQFTRWIYASGKVNNGLIKRRLAEKQLFISA